MPIVIKGTFGSSGIMISNTPALNLQTNKQTRAIPPGGILRCSLSTRQELTTMEKSYKRINQQQRQLGRTYREKSPDTMNAFLALHKAALADGALSSKYKELIATGIAIAARCDGCIAAHVSAALRAGATKEELLETIDVAILMGGGPSLIYGTQALAAVEELSA